MENNIDLNAVLDFLDPSTLDYTEWTNVGMALKEEGYSCNVWEQWSARDSARYHPGECEKKWCTFGNYSGAVVTAGSVVQMALDRGWKPKGNFEDRALDWDDQISDDYIIVDKAYIQEEEIKEPVNFNPVNEIVTYLETLFSPDETVGYVVESWKNDKGKYVPSKGAYDRTAGELIRKLNECNGDIGLVLGDYNKEAGAWIRFNPLDGKGVKNENVTEYRYALVESDNMDLSRQQAILKELELPIAVLVYSGKKSIHAIVRVDASDFKEYQKRVEYLYNICTKNGMSIDKQNKNPSRLSRLPGVIRDNHKQFIIDTNIGKSSWDEWYEWIEGVNDNLPEPESMESVWDNLPELAPPLIDGVLRQGHKMLVAGPSKAGKSYALIELCCSIAEGKSWMGFNCAQGKVLYVNLELDRASCLHRFKDVYSSLHWQPKYLSNIDIWNLRGNSIPMDKLAPKLIRRAAKKNYIAVIIDPIYKVITGDENSADQMAKFCNQFDKVCTELGCAVIYCHHHSKGGQGNKKSMDRASGSGVFARDPDALLDLIELEVSEEITEQQTDREICNMCQKWLVRFNTDLEDYSRDDLIVKDKILSICKRELNDNTLQRMWEEIRDLKKKIKQRTAWRIEGTLREFPKFEPLNVWFSYPVHKIDDSDVLKDISTEEKPFWQRGKEKRKENAKSKRDKINLELEMAYSLLSSENEVVTIGDIAEEWSMSKKGVKDRINKSDDFYYENGIVYRKEESGND